MKILMSGASGLLGSRLQELFRARGDRVVCLVRRLPRDATEIQWDPANNVLNASDLEGFDAVIHLSGENVAGGRWTSAMKERIRESRVRSTELLSNRIAGCVKKPQVVVIASAIGIYGERADVELSEEAGPGTGFLPEVGVAWEQASAELDRAGVRVARMRLGVVLAREGGALQKMWVPFSLGVGGVVGTGRQYMSWVHVEDAARAFIHAIDDSRISGPVNVAAPQPVTNREFTKALGEALRRPTVFPLPAWVVSLLFGEMGRTLLLGSTRVVPSKLLALGFSFSYPTVHKALEAIVRGKSSAR